MVDQSLVTYVKQNLRDGFAEGEIQTALVGAGWNAQDITQAFVEAGARPPKPAAAVDLPEELVSGDLNYSPGEQGSFLSRHGRLLIIIVVLIILLPILAYGGFWAYQRFTAPSPAGQTPTTPPPVQPPAPPAAPKIDPQAAARDQQRLKDIGGLQISLESHLTAKQAYPKLLDQLVAEKILTAVPLDPKSGVQYLYSPLGEPTLDYSLSFILETDIGTLQKGLNEVSPGKPLKPATVQMQDDMIRGLTTQNPSSGLSVTDLTLTSFYPGEEVSVVINSTTSLEQVFLLVNHLKLVDEHLPFNIHFTAPKVPGEYPVQIFGFDSEGGALSQTTKLIVKQ